MISAEITKWVVLILVVGAVIFVIKAGMKILNILIMVAILGFCWFSFFTEEGAARLSIALLGHPFVAYTTGMQKQDNMSNDNVTYYKTTKDVIVDGKKQEYIKCYTKWIVRIPSVSDVLE